MHRRNNPLTRFFSIMSLALLMGCAASAEGPAPSHKAITIKNAQGFPLTLASLTRDGDNIQAVFCTSQLAAGEWQLGTKNADVELSFKWLKYDSNGAGYFTDGAPGAERAAQGAERCALALFFVQGWPDLPQVTLTVNRLATPMPAAPDCEKARAKLKSKGIDITFECQAGDHSFSFTILKTPANLTMEQARDAIYEEGFIDTIPGPWTFTSGFFASSGD